jgi:hypothetical protein
MMDQELILKKVGAAGFKNQKRRPAMAAFCLKG